MISRKAKKRPPRRVFIDRFGVAKETRTKFLPQNAVTVRRNAKQYRHNLERSSKWMDTNLGTERNTSFPRNLAGRLIVRREALGPERCRLKLKLARGRDGTGRLKETL